MKMFILLTALLFQGNGGVISGGSSVSGVPKRLCIKSLDVSPCSNCLSLMTIKCISGDEWQSCAGSTTYECITPANKIVRCKQEHAGNSCDQQSIVESGEGTSGVAHAQSEWGE